MIRREIRALKQAVADNNDLAAMHALLARSVKFQHKKLALMRCLQAEQMGVSIAADLLVYCRRVAERMPADDLLRLVAAAGRRIAHARGASPFQPTESSEQSL